MNISIREQDVLEMLVTGLSNKEIAARLDISPFTARNHLAHIFEKLRVRSRTAAVVTYLRGTSTKPLGSTAPQAQPKAKRRVRA